MQSLTLTLSEHAAAISLERLPPAVIDAAKLCLLDTLGCAIGGAAHPAIVAMRKALPGGTRTQTGTIRRAAAGELGRGLDGPLRAGSVWGAGRHAPAPAAALLNGAAAHVLNFDDAHKTSMGHPGTVVVPAALVAAEATGASGASLLEAIVAGYDVLLRVGIGVGAASHRARGWYATASLGPFGAATAAAKLLGLDADGMAGAIGLAASQASGLWSFAAEGSLANVVAVGRAAELGLIAALLTRAGLPGPRRVLEADDGGFLAATSDASAPALMREGLGERFQILDVSLKPYPCSRTTHAPIDAALRLRVRAGGAPRWVDDVREVRVHTYAVAKRQADIPDPTSGWMATLSIPYTVAIALLEGRVAGQHFTARYLEDDRVRRFCRKVSVMLDDELSAQFPGRWSCRVELVRGDGTRYSETVDTAHGDPHDPLTGDEVRAKVSDLARDRLSDDAREKLFATVAELERVKDLTRLATLLRDARGA